MPVASQLLAVRGTFSPRMSSGAAALLWPLWGWCEGAAAVPGPPHPFLGCRPEPFWSSAGCLGKLSAAGVDVWSLTLLNVSRLHVWAEAAATLPVAALSCHFTSDGLYRRVLPLLCL